MELLTAVASFLAGGLIGSMLQFLIGRKSLQQYAAALLMDQNQTLTFEVKTLRRELDESNAKRLALRTIIIDLESRLKEVERLQNGDNKNNKK